MKTHILSSDALSEASRQKAYAASFFTPFVCPMERQLRAKSAGSRPVSSLQAGKKFRERRTKIERSVVGLVSLPIFFRARLLSPLRLLAAFVDRSPLRNRYNAFSTDTNSLSTSV